MLIREATAEDWPAIWPFFHEIVSAGDTFTYPTDLGEDESREMWMLAAPNRTVVAVDDTGDVVGSAKMNSNQGGPGSHIASASYMVAAAHSGRGVGRALCEYSLAWARETGFRGCSSTRSLRRIRGHWRYTGHSASRCWARCPGGSGTRHRDTWACTSCT